MTDKKNPKWVPQLLAWYDVHKRELPWRDCGDPYKIWVSEVMSQQTRIEAMKPYYDNWMRLFPTLEELAKATEDEVVHAWQGLGYYSRARNLRLGVKDVVENYGGIVPRDRKTMESLKGVGSYTAGAVLSMAYNEPEVAVDGNVLRIYARLYRIFDDILSTKGKKAITAIVEETDEMEPHWLTVDEIPYEHMWDGDRQWLPMLLEDKKLKGPIVFDRDNSSVDKMDLTTVDTVLESEHLARIDLYING